MAEDPLVDEALQAFRTDLDYATSMVNMHVSSGAFPPADRPALVEWGSPPRFVAPAEVPPPGPEDEPEPG